VCAAALAAGVLTTGPVAIAGGSQGAAASPKWSPRATYYAIGRRACKMPKKLGIAACFADIRVLVKEKTPGAVAFKIGPRALTTDGVGPAGGLTPADLVSAYNLPHTGGTGQTVAIVDAYNDPNINVDLQTFDSHYGLATCSVSNGCLKVVGETGSTSSLPGNDSTGWSVEESLDVETVHAVCQACKILLVEATSPTSLNLGTSVNEAVKLGANEVTNSYGAPEAGSTATIQGDYNHPGTVITASAGDDGYYDFDYLGTNGLINQPNIPAAYPTVVAVGGTTLDLNQTGGRQSESVWNDNGTQDYWEATLSNRSLASLTTLGASGGGCSTLFTAQGWQSHESDWAKVACGTSRLVSDVAADADYLTGMDVYDSWTCASCVPAPGWYTIGGTSLASPIVASVYALAGGAHGVNYPAIDLYGHPGKLYNVTTGGDGFCDGVGAWGCTAANWGVPAGIPNVQGWGVVDCAWSASGVPAAGDLACDAAPGFNGPTGMGTPNGITAFQKTGPSATISGPKSIAHGTSGTWKATATDPFPGGSVKSYKWNWGDGSSPTTTTTNSASHTYTSAASRTITVTMTDNYGQTGTATYPVTVS
jgi:subtilase family serine protease